MDSVHIKLYHLHTVSRWTVCTSSSTICTQCLDGQCAHQALPSAHTRCVHIKMAQYLDVHIKLYHLHTVSRWTVCTSSSTISTLSRWRHIKCAQCRWTSVHIKHYHLHTVSRWTVCTSSSTICTQCLDGQCAHQALPSAHSV